MIIKKLGHSCFKIKNSSASIICDPFDPKKTGLSLPKQTANIVTVSHDHFDHNFIEIVEGEYFLINTPGEYEIKGVYIYGYKTFHDNKNGAERGPNTVYSIKIDNINIVHLGDLGHKLPDELVGELEETDVLLIPVGGTYTIEPEIATEVISQLEPSIVIPMHYKVDGINADFDKLKTVEDFTKAMGWENVQKLDKLVLSSRSALPQDTQVVII